MNNSELVKQSLDFSVSIVDYYKWLTFNRKEFIMSKQILRSGTSIGANIYEAKFAVSTPDFINKLHISLKEVSETEYWLILLEKTGYTNKEHIGLKVKCTSIKKMLIATLNTLKLRTLK